jgi:hypothetical protein
MLNGLSGPHDGRPVMRDDYSSVAPLVARAAEGDQAAWNEIVERYAPLVGMKGTQTVFG